MVRHPITTAGHATTLNSTQTLRPPSLSRSLLRAKASCSRASASIMSGPGGKPRPPLLNARTDGLRKGQFRTHLRTQRCVIPAEGFYEWREEGGKQPYYFSRKDGKPLMLAGIWQTAEYKGDKRTAFAILTDEPNELVSSYHDRMPLALADDKVATWLDLSNEAPLDENVLLDLGAFTVRPMDRAMNNARQKDLPPLIPRRRRPDHANIKAVFISYALRSKRRTESRRCSFFRASEIRAWSEAASLPRAWEIASIWDQHPGLFRPCPAQSRPGPDRRVRVSGHLRSRWAAVTLGARFIPDLSSFDLHGKWLRTAIPDLRWPGRPYD